MVLLEIAMSQMSVILVLKNRGSLLVVEIMAGGGIKVIA